MKTSAVASVVLYTVLAHAGARNELEPYTGGCEANTRPICAQSSKMALSDPSLGNVTAGNPTRCELDADYWIEQTDKVLNRIDALYNGTTKMESKNNGAGNCPDGSSTSSYQYQLRIGSTGKIAGTNLTRSLYDNNPFYMYLTWFYPALNENTANANTTGDVYMVSSQSWFEYGQQWNLSSTKSGDGFDIAGSLTTHKYSDIQGLWYRIGECASSFSSWDYKTDFLILDCNVMSMTMKGHISPDKAEIVITAVVYGRPGNPTLTWTFNGNSIPGPKLLTTEANPITDGKLNVTGSTGAAGTASGMGASAGSWAVAGLAMLASFVLL
ncbi:hypothetical protein P154DRAFT_614551 [Amniculicola lignicola CBS 123094]|uniref:Lytic polysaccharide monooxygenase n=1 Tax=Amniculicola lignicola CBS 123094 TaxID=1392246 RepID=A0A6A5X5G3_9PLEO|nr:hypothetical protein P154DRAFT_614551 [Amniculicola lignicola CBS 123094]